MMRLQVPTLLFAFALTAGLNVHAQLEGPVPTQALVNVDAKSKPPASAAAVTVEVNGRKEPLTAWTPVAPAGAQVVLLIDDGLRESVGRELSNLQQFVRTLAPGIEVMVGYMQYGTVQTAQSFTTDHEYAATRVHLPDGIVDMSASPYICLSDFVKNWPNSAGGSSSASASSSSASGGSASSLHKARFMLLLTNGVDPYNGSTSVMNQGSPYVDAAVEDAQRAGVVVSAIYFTDAGMFGGMTDNSGQDYLNQIAEETGGINYWQGIGNPVSTAPFLAMFQHAIAETYIASFIAPTGRDPERDLVHVKFTAARTKLHATEKVLPGNRE